MKNINQANHLSIQRETDVPEKKLNNIDWARIIGIYLVVLGHMQSCGLSISIKNFIYLFHMPLFFVISGMLHKNGLKRCVNSFLGHLWLYFLFNAVFMVVHSLHHNDIDICYATTANTPTWFFLSLGIIKLICYNISRMTAISSTLICVITIQCIHSFGIDISPYYYVKSILMALPFFLLGYYAKKIFLHSHAIMFSILCGSILIWASIVYGRVDVFQGVFKYTYIDYFIVAVCGVFVVSEISNRITPPITVQNVRFYGQYHVERQ